MHKGDKVSILKIQPVDSPKAPTPEKGNWDQYCYLHSVSVPCGHQIEGRLLEEIEVGKRVVVFRDKQNGEASLGLFETSLVTEFEIAGDFGYFKTENSIYSIQKI